MTLLAPAFLLAAAVIALPLWLHRREQRELARREVASLAFFEAQDLRVLPRRRFRQPLLLALRCVLLGVAALAFAQPLFPVPEAVARASAPTLHVFVLDASLSMGHGERWARALRALDAELARLAGGERAQLFVAGAALRALGEPSADVAPLRASLDALAPGASRVEYDALMRDVRAALERGAAPAERRVVHLISDFQRSALPARWIDLLPAPGVELRLHAVADPADANWLVDDVVATPGPAGDVRIEAGVRGFHTPEREQTLRLWIDDQDVARATQRVPADGRAGFGFAAPASRATRRVRVALETPDALPADDERRLVLAPRDLRPILFVGQPRDRAFVHLSTALPDLSARLQVHASAELEALPLDAYAALVIADVELSARAWARIRSAVESGGSALVALGPRLGAPAARRELALTGHVLLPSSPAAEAFAPRWDASAEDVEHPALGELAAWRDVKVFQHARIEPRDGDEVLLRADADRPLLLEHALGAGRVLLFASSLDAAWNDLPLRPAFAPFARAALRYLGERHDRVSQARVGERLPARGDAVQVLAPDGTALLSLAETQGGGDVVLEQAGFYEVRSGGEAHPIAVNPDPRESDPSALRDDELARWSAAPGAPREGVATAPEAARVEPARVPRTGFLLGALLALVLVELAVANWQARPREAKLW